MRLTLLLLVALLAGCGEPATQGPTALGSPTTVPPPAFEYPVPRLATLGYGHALSAAFAPGGQALMVGTSAGLLRLRLPDLAILDFHPHDMPTHQIAVSLDERYVAVWAQRSTLVIELGRDALNVIPGGDPVFSPGGDMIAVSVVDEQFGAPTTQIERVPRGGLVAELPGDGAVFSPDGTLVATTGAERVTLWDTESGQSSAEVPAASVAFAADRAMVAFAGASGIEVFTLERGRLAERIFAAPGLGRAVALADDGSLVVGFLGGQLRSWSLPDGAPLAAVEGVGAEVVGVAPGGLLAWSMTAGGESPGALRVVRAADGAELYADGERGGGTPAFSSDGRQAAIVHRSGRVTLLGEEGLLASREVAGYGAVAFAPEGDHIFAARLGGVDRWALSGGEAPEAVVGGGADRLGQVRELTPEGTRLVAEEEIASYLGGTWRLEVRAWDRASGQQLGQLRVEELPPEAVGAGVQLPWDYSPAGELLAWVAADGALMVDDPAGGEPRPLPPLPGVPGGASPTVLAFSPDGARLAVGYSEGTLILVDAAALLPLAAGPPGAGQALRSLAWSGDGRWLAMSADGGEVLAWEAGEDDSPRRLSTISQRAGSAPALALSGDGAVLTVGWESSLHIYRLDRDPAAPADQPSTIYPGSIDAIALSPDGTAVAAAVDGRIVIWSVP